MLPILPKSTYATNSFRIRRVPSRLPTVAQSFHLTPNSHATGAKMRPRINCSDPGIQPSNRVWCSAKRIPLTSAISPMNAINIAPTFSASCKPSDAPREAASIMFTPGRSTSIFDSARRGRKTGLGNHHFRQHQRGRCGHDDGGKQMADLDVRDQNVRRHHRAGDVRHAAGHHGEQLAFRHRRQKRADGEWRFGLAHEDAGGDVHGFRAAGAEDPLHHDGHGPHQNLHHAQVVEDAEQAPR